MKISILSIFPEIILEFCKHSIIGKSLQKKLWELNVVNIRDYSEDKHKRVDDTPYGGEQGLIMRPDVLGNSIDANCKNSKIFYMTPRGRVLNQEKIKEIINNYSNISILCGRYEGVDERIIDEYNIEEISIGDFVVMGGELPSLVMLEAIIRCLDGVVGDIKSTEEDSFGGISNNIFNDLLEYPLYTKPEIWRNRKVPDVLLSGHHKNIRDWKINMAEKITKERRLDIFEKYLKKNNKIF